MVMMVGSISMEEYLPSVSCLAMLILSCLIGIRSW